MVKFINARGPAGRLLIGLGLSRGNCAKLLAKQSIHVDLGEIDPRAKGIEVLIFGGETEAQMVDELGALISTDTKVSIDPRLQVASITCPRCGRTSYNPNDIEQRYCGNCHQFHDQMTEAERLG